MPEAEKVLRIANMSIQKAVQESKEWLPELDEDWMKVNQGAFTTIYTLANPGKQLRGCIGLPFPTEMAGNAVAISARKAALEDPRFPRLKHEELGNIVISVELLSDYDKLTWISLEDLMEQIELGTHGLRIHYGRQAGILLPRVPVEHSLSKEDYLEAICRKAGLHFEILNAKEVELYTFTSKFFSEY